MDNRETRARWADIPCEDTRERAWERQMHFAGVDRFNQKQEKSEKGGTSETAGGQKMLKKCLTTAIQGIRKAQAETLSNRAPRNLKGTAVALSPETCALLTLRHLMDLTYAPEDFYGVSYQIACKNLSRAVELELNFLHWMSQSEADAKEWAEEQGYDKAPTSLAQRRIKQEGKITGRTLARWKETIDDLCEYRWDELERHYCGDTLITAVCDALPDCFTIHSPWVRGRQVKSVKMTDEFRFKIDQSQTRIAAMQTTKKPMLSKPMRWEQVE